MRLTPKTVKKFKTLMFEDKREYNWIMPIIGALQTHSNFILLHCNRCFPSTKEFHNYKCSSHFKILVSFKITANKAMVYQ